MNLSKGPASLSSTPHWCTRENILLNLHRELWKWLSKIWLSKGVQGKNSLWGGVSLDRAILDCVVCKGIWQLGPAGFGGGQSFAGYLILALVFVRGFHFAGGTGRWAIILGNFGIFLIITNFLRFLVLSRLATRIYYVCY